MWTAIVVCAFAWLVLGIAAHLAFAVAAGAKSQTWALMSFLLAVMSVGSLTATLVMLVWKLVVWINA